MFFSIVIPLYNKKEYVRKSLNSVLNQTYSNFEVIVVDDGSTDGSLEELSDIEDFRLRFIKKNNGGVSSARNIGITNSRYEHICFLDADDFWESSYLENMVLLINEYPSHLFYSSSFGYILDGKVISSVFHSDNQQKFQSVDIIKYGLGNKRYAFPINASNMIIKKSAFEKVGFFNENLSFFEDYDLYVRLAQVGRLAFLNCSTPLSYYVKDIVVEKQATSRLPMYTKHFISIIPNWDTNISRLTKKYLRYFYAEYALNYRLSGIADVENDLKKMKSQFLSIRYFILYSSLFSLFVKFFNNKNV